MGDMSIYRLRLDSGKVVRVTQPNIYRHADDRITWEERVYLQLVPGEPRGGDQVKSLPQATGTAGAHAVTAVPYLWLLLFFLIPFVIVLKISFSTSQIAMPPYEPLLHWTGDKVMQISSTSAISRSWSRTTCTGEAYLNSIKVAAISTILCLLIGYPMAYAMARSNPSTRNILLLLVIAAVLDVVPAARVCLDRHPQEQRLHQQCLLSLGMIDQPIQMLQTDFAVYIGIVYRTCRS